MLVAGNMFSNTCTRSQVRAMAAGFTLIELMVTIAVAAVLASLAAPSFRQYIVTQRIRNASFDLITALTLTRSEALTRNGDVNFIQSGGNWANGWTVSPAVASPPTLLTQEAFKGLKITDSAGISTITYGKDGRTSTATTKFQIEPVTAMSGVKTRCISVSLSGLPSSTEGACS